MTRIALGDLPRLHAADRPRTFAVRYPEGELTWSQLEERASQRARLFHSLEVGEGEFLVLSLPNSCALHEAIFAAWKLGATPMIVSPKLPAHEFSAVLELMRPRLTVGGPDLGVTEIRRISGLEDLSAFDSGPVEACVGPYLRALCSGGSTGQPKVVVDHIAPVWDPDEPSMTHVLKQLLGIEADSVTLVPGPLYHAAPFIFSHVSLFAGGTVIGMSRFDAEECLRLIDRHRVSVVNFVPTMMHRIMSLPRAVRESYDVSSLKTVWHMAAPCPAWLKQAWIDWLGAEVIWELYGGVENYGSTIIRGDEWLTKRGSVGRIVGNSRIKAVREDGTDCATGEIGELFFLIPDPNNPATHYIGAEPRRNADGWQSLGDLGRIDEDGFVFLADRRTDLILRGGANVYPAEVEAALDACEEIASSIVIGLPCEDMGQRVHAIVQPRREETLDLERVHGFLSTRLAKYKLPESYDVVRVALRDDAGKARRSALRDERIMWRAQGKEFEMRPRR